MIGRKSQHREESGDDTSPQSFDDYALKLGDVMRGERATMGKSLLDVQRELRIKASYIAAIENCDPSAFDTPGFIAGYVRSYARYLGMDPDEAFTHFCTESGFSVAHGMSQEASVIRKPRQDAARARNRDSIVEPRMPFAPANDSLLSRIEPGALGSSLVLLALIGGIGYGGYRVLQEVQRVQVTPVDQTPIVLSELDPLQAAIAPAARDEGDDITQAGVFTPPTTEAFDRLYRPQALDVPVLVARDAPISTLDPERVGAFAGRGPRGLPNVQDSSLAAAALANRLVAEGVIPESAVGAAPVGGLAGASGVTVVAVRPAWIEVRSETDGVLISRVLNAGETFAVPRDASSPRIRVGESGAVYFNVDGRTYGPAGQPGRVTGNVSLAGADVVDRFDLADSTKDRDLASVLVDLNLAAPQVALAEPVQRAAQTPIPTDLARNVPNTPPVARPDSIALAAAIAVAPTPSVPAPQPVAPAPVEVAKPAPEPIQPNVPRVTAEPAPGITVVAVAETWVEITSPSGKKLLARLLKPGDTYKVPQTDQAPTIFSGNAGGVFFAVNGETYGPYGASGQFGRDLALSAGDIQREMQVADLTRNQTLAKVVAELQLQGQ
ncbi:helix-turn-helix domain-containing protein [uncultured Mameliella sp.]|uniref:helix-turn-helix domain-containing protein n=1 Tax=uncultured Mameliella sp. TaxID=1447087 RepID=UPI002622FA1F|nr:helix-turn-helix domain-containing protein [uncultured Mameliella sp.]